MGAWKSDAQASEPRLLLIITMRGALDAFRSGRKAWVALMAPNTLTS